MIHHLDDPAAGLKAILNVLRPAGGLLLMVYGTLGRVGVYPVQEMLRDLAPATEPAPERIAMAKRLLGVLPQTNWLQRSPHITDHRGSDVGIYDLLLHSIDKSYTVMELADLLASVGLRITTFAESALYEPAFWCKDEFIARRLNHLSHIRKAAFAERFLSFIKMHIVFVVRQENPVAQPVPNLAAVPIWATKIDDKYPDLPFSGGYSLQSTPMNVQFTAVESQVVRLIDGEKSIGQIMEISGLPRSEFDRAFLKVWSNLHGIGVLFLRLPQ